jgi:transcription termination factor Rho
MSVLDRTELEASPLADLHAIADQLGIDGFRRLRKAQLIDVILADQPDAGGDGKAASDRPSEEDKDEEADAADGDAPTARSRRPGSGRSRRRSPERPEGSGREGRSPRPDGARRAPRADREERGERGPRPGGENVERPGAREEQVADGVVELLGNGSAFLRVEPPEPSDNDVYVSAAQVRRCELVSGDRVTGPVRPPRRSERYPSLVRVDTINGAPVEAVTEGTPYETLACAFPSERISLDGEDATLRAIDSMAPLGRGSRVVILGGARAGKTEALRRLAGALTGQDGVEVSLVLVGVRPEEIGEWQQGPAPVAAAHSFVASSDTQSQAVERAIDTAKRVAARGGHAVVLIDCLDGLHPPAARKALAAARNLVEGGSLTVIATATRALGGETTVIALDSALTAAGRLPALDPIGSGTLRAELLVGEDGAQAIVRARADALGS